MPALVLHPRETVTFEQFAAGPAPAVALDGYVSGPSRYVGAHCNLNHHEDCDRFTTRATCEQVALAITARYPLFVGGGGGNDELAIHANDCDPDVALSTWLLRHPEMATHPVAARIVHLEGVVDVTGGAAGGGTLDELNMLAWLIEPWATERHRLADADAAGMATIVDEICDRATAAVAGRPGFVDVAGGYEILDQRGGVWAVVEHHPLARARLCADGADIFVSVRDDGPGRSHVSVGRASVFTPIDLDEVWASLNELEGCDGLDRWGGSDLVGGSPRHAGTALDLDDIVEVINSHLRN